MPDVDLFVRSSGEQRTSNFLLWQTAYAEMVFLDTLFPDFDRRHLWEAVEIYARRDRRFGGALDKPGRVMTRVNSSRGGGTRSWTSPGRRWSATTTSPSTTTARSPSRHGDVVCARAGHRSWTEGLPVINLTCVVAWDLPRDDDVPTRVAMGAGEGLFGTPRVIRGERGWDVTFRYAFPAAGLEEKAMGTLLMLVVGGASSMRAELTSDERGDAGERAQPPPGVEHPLVRRGRGHAASPRVAPGRARAGRSARRRASRRPW